MTLSSYKGYIFKKSEYPMVAPDESVQIDARKQYSGSAFDIIAATGTSEEECIESLKEKIDNRTIQDITLDMFRILTHVAADGAPSEAHTKVIEAFDRFHKGCAEYKTVLALLSEVQITGNEDVRAFAKSVEYFICELWKEHNVYKGYKFGEPVPNPGAPGNAFLLTARKDIENEGTIFDVVLTFGDSPEDCRARLREKIDRRTLENVIEDHFGQLLTLVGDIAPDSMDELTQAVGAYHDDKTEAAINHLEIVSCCDKKAIIQYIQSLTFFLDRMAERRKQQKEDDVVVGRLIKHKFTDEEREHMDYIISILNDEGFINVAANIPMQESDEKNRTYKPIEDGKSFHIAAIRREVEDEYDLPGFDYYYAEFTHKNEWWADDFQRTLLPKLGHWCQTKFNKPLDPLDCLLYIMMHMHMAPEGKRNVRYEIVDGYCIRIEHNEASGQDIFSSVRNYPENQQNEVDALCAGLNAGDINMPL